MLRISNMPHEQKNNGHRRSNTKQKSNTNKLVGTEMKKLLLKQMSNQ